MSSIALHHAWWGFDYIPESVYQWVCIDYFDLIHLDTFSLIEVNHMVTELGYDGIMFYHYLVPEMTVDDGLRMLRVIMTAGR